MAMTADERRESKFNDLILTLDSYLDKEKNDYPEEELNKSLGNIKRNVSNLYSESEVDNYLQDRRDKRTEEARETVLNANPLLETRQIRNKGGLLEDDREQYAEGEVVEKTITLDTILFENDKEKRVSIRDALEKSRPDSVYAYMQSGNKDWLFSTSYGDEGGEEYQSGQMPKNVGKKRLAILQSLFDSKDVLSEALPIGTRTKKAEGGEIIKDYKKQLKKYKDIWSDESEKYTKKEQAKAGEEHNIIAQTMNQYVEDPIEILVGPFKKTEVGKPGYNRKTKRTLYEKGGELDDQMEMMLGRTEETPMEEQMTGVMGESEEQPTMLPDEEMEEDYVDYVVGKTLSEEDNQYLMSMLEQDDRLSVIFDQVVESATEFSGEGPVDGPGTETSDSIPARLSDGEFVITAKAAEEIGVDNLMSMMKNAEVLADNRQMAYEGGSIREEKEVMAAPKEPQQQNINVTKTTLDDGALLSRDQEDLVGNAVKENMMLDPYQRHVRS